MPALYNSKHGTVSRSSFELYMAFVDMRNFVQMLPEDKRADVTADYDSIKTTVQGFSIGIRVKQRVPYSLLSFEDDGAPFKFELNFHFDQAADPSKTDFYIDASADLNLVMKAMLGNRVQQALDRIVDSMVDASEGRMPKDFKL